MSSRDRVETAAKQGYDACMSGYKRGRRGFIYVVTSDKIIQSVLTGSLTSALLSINEGVAVFVRGWITALIGGFVPVKIVASVGAALIFVAAYWADSNTEAWREWVRQTTGEEPAEDTAADEDVTGEQKTDAET
jgi:hypothetical protein